MYKVGARVRYVGDMSEVKGMPGVVKGPGRCAGRSLVEWLSLGSTLDMSDTVLENDTPEVEEMAKSTTTVTHPDGTQSTRTSATMTYTHAVESREDRWAYAKLQREQAAKTREAKAKFIEAVRGGKVVIVPEPSRAMPNYKNIYVVHPDGERFWLGAEGGYTSDTLNRKEAVREHLADSDSLAGRFEAEAREAESGAQYAYGVWRWSQSLENAHKAARDFERNRTQGITTFRVVEVDA